MRRKEVLIVSVLLVLFVLVNISLFTKGEYTHDVRILQQWGNVALTEGVASLYVQNVASSDRKTTYPPLYLYVLKFNSWLSLKLFGDNTPLTNHYNIISKSVPAFCNLLIGLAIWLYLRKQVKWASLVAMGAYFFNLAVIYSTSYWGQIDSAHTLFMVLSVIFLVKNRFVLSSAFWTLAFLTKAQSIVLLPVIAVVILSERDLKKAAMAAGTCILLALAISAPIIGAGLFVKMINTMLASVDFAPLATVNAHNVWYLIAPGLPNDWGKLTLDTQAVLGVSYKTIGLGALGLFTGIVLWQLWKKRNAQTIIFSASSLALGFFMLPTQIHERYLFPFFALFALGMMSERKYVAFYFLLAITFLLNLMWALPALSGATGFYQIQLVLDWLYQQLSIIKVGLGLAVANVVLFVWYVKNIVLPGFLQSLKWTS